MLTLSAHEIKEENSYISYIKPPDSVLSGLSDLTATSQRYEGSVLTEKTEDLDDTDADSHSDSDSNSSSFRASDETEAKMSEFQGLLQRTSIRLHPNYNQSHHEPQNEVSMNIMEEQLQAAIDYLADNQGHSHNQKQEQHSISVDNDELTVWTKTTYI